MPLEEHKIAIEYKIIKSILLQQQFPTFSGDSIRKRNCCSRPNASHYAHIRGDIQVLDLLSLQNLTEDTHAAC